MKSVLHIQLVEDYQQIPFQSEVQHWISNRFPDMDFFGLDNYSAPEMITYAQEMIRLSSLMLIVLEPRSERANPRKLIRLFNQIGRKKPEYVYVALLERHPLVEKMMKVREDQFRPGLGMPQLKDWAVDLFA